MAKVVIDVSIGDDVRLVVTRERDTRRAQVAIVRWVQPRAKGRARRKERRECGTVDLAALSWLRRELDVVLGFETPSS